MSTKYAIIIDSGSSGSRSYIYEYSQDGTTANALPNIKQVSSKKTKRGLSTFSKSIDSIWGEHFEPLIKHAEEIIPSSLHSSTPIFVQATAGMRLIKPKYRKKILRETCKSLKNKSKFLINNCSDHVSVIDGDTEGIYGWLALNYMSDKLKTDLTPYGFMDMGGASTQLAFSPTNNEDLIEHGDDMYKVSLRNNKGEILDWQIFVSSWLGFGANEARNRQLSSLLNALPKGVNYDVDGDGKGDITDPCSPDGMKIEFEYDDKIYSITGSGDYETCIKTIYPLLLKNLKCEKEPCLFNGVHGPKMDWSKEKIVGVSEYWYTANDVFKLGGTYDYEKFETATKEFCSTNWNTLVENFNAGDYGDQLSMDLLRTSCFKASWIINVLHEGFDLPRVGVDDAESDLTTEPMFKSIKNVNDHELNWTLGKMVLYASSQIKGNGEVGIIPGTAIILPTKENIWGDDDTPKYEKNVVNQSIDFTWLASIFFLLTLISIGYLYVLKKYGGLTSFMKKVHQYKPVGEEWIDLEEGRSLSRQGRGTLRTRSTMNLQEEVDQN